MCRQIRQQGFQAKPAVRRKSYIKHVREDGHFPGDKVQINLKYVPVLCVRFPTYGDRYYQITAIDEYSRERALSIVREKSSDETALFLDGLEDRFGFRIQVDNGREFANDEDVTDKVSAFMQVCLMKGYQL